ncbi:MAG: golvesin C-terminal-like domain-containing protein [Planctomycetota bacterium]|jgi:hypothetical protein
MIRVRWWVLAIACVLPAGMAVAQNGPKPGDIIIDNADATGVEFAGKWQSRTNYPKLRYGDNFAWVNGGAEGASVTFTPRLPKNGEYEVFIRYITFPKSSRKVPIAIHHADGVTNKGLNQKSGSGQWMPLGKYRFEAGDAGRVVISAKGAKGMIVVDAIRFSTYQPPSAEKSSKLTKDIRGPKGTKSTKTSWTSEDDEVTVFDEAVMSSDQPRWTKEQIRDALKQVTDPWAKKTRNGIADTLHLVETEHFLIYSAWPQSDDDRLAKDFESVHDALRERFGVAEDEPIWLGKVAAFVFVEGEHFEAFAKTVDSARRGTAISPEGVSYANEMFFRDGIAGGYLAISYRATKPGMRESSDKNFLASLTHELTHLAVNNQLHRTRIPLWVREGLAEYTAAAVSSGGHAEWRRDEARRKALAEAHDVPGVFKRDEALAVVADGIDEYGVAHSLVRFLYEGSREGFDRYCRLLRDGEFDEPAMKAAFGFGHEEFVTLWKEGPQKLVIPAPVGPSQEKLCELIRASIGKWADEAKRSVAPAMHLVETDHFMIYSAWTAEHDDLLADTCESTHKELRKVFAVADDRPLWPGKLVIFAFDDHKSFAAFGRTIEKAFADGQAVGNLKSYLRPFKITSTEMTSFYASVSLSPAEGPNNSSAVTKFRTRLIKSATMAFLGGYPSRGNLPVWLSAAITQRMSAVIVPTSRQAQRWGPAAITAADKKLDIKSIFRSTGPLRVHEYGLDEYGVAQSFLRILRQRDADAFVQYYLLLKDGKTEAEALRQAYKLDHSELISLWRKKAPALANAMVKAERDALAAQRAGANRAAAQGAFDAMIAQWAQKAKDDLGAKLRVVETDHFRIYTTWKKSEEAFLIKAYKKLYERLCKDFNIPEGTEVWPGKLPVFIFWEPEHFVQFATTILPGRETPDGLRSVGGTQYTLSANGHLFHYVVLTRQTIREWEEALPWDRNQFLSSLVHETVHAFNATYLGQGGMPLWLNGGIAEFLAASLVPKSRTASRWRKANVDVINKGYRLKPMFTRWHLISEPRGRDEYGMAQSFTRFLYSLDKKKFIQMYKDIKALSDQPGQAGTGEEVIKKVYGYDLAELEKGWRKWIGAK